ncbi:MAG: RCC1 domain-containing protein [Prosthecobacter sp.]|uniref:RCC1 domain-containing protein n=1 Tax=Prosthecobacter sp. TaxID=1965333 RepID=UPI0039029CBC
MNTHTLLAALWLGSTAVIHAAPFGWGSNAYGQLGNGSTTDTNVPAATMTSGALSGKVLTKISTSEYNGTTHTLVVSSDGQIFAWGRNDSGQLGDGSTVDRTSAVAVDMSGVLFGKTVVDVAAGGGFSLAVTSDGSIYSWGNNSVGQLGDGTSTVRHVPVAVDMTGVLFGKVVKSVSAGSVSAAALTSDGYVFTWGRGIDGQLGNGTSGSSLVPVAVDTTGVLSGKIVTSISMGSFFCLAVASDGKAFSWGLNVSGMLGDGTATDRNTPVAVDASGVLSGKNLVAVGAGREHSLAVSSDGLVYAWGYGGDGEMGNGSATGFNLSPVATDMSGAMSGKVVVAVSAGSSFSLALTSDGELFSWGQNGSGNLGDGTTTERHVPVAVDMTGALLGMSATSVSAGFGHVVVLASPSTSTITPACRFSYAANFGWQNWRWSAVSPAAPAIESAILHGNVYSANVGWIDLGDGTPTSGIRYSQTGQDYGVNHDGAGALTGYAYGANIGWIRFAQTWNSPPRVNLTTGALSGYAYSANCGWIHLGSLKTRISTGADSEVLAGGGTGDGIADSWELERLAAAGLGSNLNLLGYSANADYDGDGISDYNEYIADTNPFSAGNRLAVTDFTYNPATGDIDLDWTGSDRRAFTIYYSTDLTSWAPIGNVQTGGSVSLTLGGPSTPHLFFKIGAALPLTQ